VATGNKGVNGAALMAATPEFLAISAYLFDAHIHLGRRKRCWPRT
jgi:hypothetical protein